MRCLTELRKFYEIPPNPPCKTNLTTLFNMSQDKENKSGAQDLARTQFFGKMPQVPKLQASMDQVAFQKLRASQKVINEPPEVKAPTPQRQEEVKVPTEAKPKEELKPASPVPKTPVEEKPASPVPSTPVEEKPETPEPQTPEEESKSPTEAQEQA